MMRRIAAIVCLTAQIAALAPIAEAGNPGVFDRAVGTAEGAVDDPWPFLASDESTGDDPPIFQESSGYKWGILGSSVGLVAGVGLAFWVKARADDRYDEYLRTADPTRSAELFASAERYDRATLIGWGMAQVSFVALLYFLTREGDRTLIPVEGEPVVRPHRDGVEVGVRLTP